MKVWPNSDEVRKLLKHPNGVAFRESGSAEWPDDSFTTRRIRDGDISLTDPTPAVTRTTKPSKPPPDA